MESKFIPTLQAGNGYTYLKLKGILDEDNLLANLLSQIQGRLLLIDMAEIDRINSCGVRDWVNWLNQIQALGIAVILLRCSPAVVSQANMVTNFAADAFIHSFFAPYVHPDTGDEQSVLIFTEDIRQNLPVRAPKIYNEQGEELEFDEFEESYFAFISDPRILNYQISPDVQAVIQYYLPEATSRQPVVGMRAQQAVQQVQGTAQPIPAQSQVSPQMLRSNLGNVPGSSIQNNPQAPRSLFGAQPMAQNPVSGMGQSGISSMAYAQSQNAQNSVMNHAMPKSGVAQGFGQPPFAQTNMGRPAPAPIQKPASTYAEGLRRSRYCSLRRPQKHAYSRSGDDAPRTTSFAFKRRRSANRSPTKAATYRPDESTFCAKRCRPHSKCTSSPCSRSRFAACTTIDRSPVLGSISPSNPAYAFGSRYGIDLRAKFPATRLCAT